jgi:hypothetical protein
MSAKPGRYDSNNIPDHDVLRITCSELKSKLSVEHNYRSTDRVDGIAQCGKVQVSFPIVLGLVYASYHASDVVGYRESQSLNGTNDGKCGYD